MQKIYYIEFDGSKLVKIFGRMLVISIFVLNTTFWFSCIYDTLIPYQGTPMESTRFTWRMTFIALWLMLWSLFSFLIIISCRFKKVVL